VIRDPAELLGREAIGDGLERLWAAVQPDRAIGGWATVELDRAEVEVAAALRDLGEPVVEPRADDVILGARCRLLRFPDDRDILLLEPSTEGRLAASLARFGEGSVALYLVVEPAAVDRASRAGFALSRPGDGPLGQERLVVTGPSWGPHLILVTDRSTDPADPPATIEA
jgi:hypothetical protein